MAGRARRYAYRGGERPAARRARRCLSLLCLCLLTLSIYFWRLGAQVVGQGQFPLPGARVVRDVRKVTGEASASLRPRAAILRRGAAGGLPVRRDTRVARLSGPGNVRTLKVLMQAEVVKASLAQHPVRADRRAILASALALAAPIPLSAQPADRIARIGVLSFTSPEPFRSAFRRALGDLGYVEGAMSRSITSRPAATSSESPRSPPSSCGRTST